MYNTPYEKSQIQKKGRSRTGKAGWKEKASQEIDKAIAEKNENIGITKPSFLCMIGLHRFRRHHTFGYIDPAWWTSHQSTAVYICTRPGCISGKYKDVTSYTAP